MEKVSKPAEGGWLILSRDPAAGMTPGIRENCRDWPLLRHNALLISMPVMCGPDRSGGRDVSVLQKSIV
jgi:hypothetical protein